MQNWHRNCLGLGLSDREVMLGEACVCRGTKAYVYIYAGASRETLITVYRLSTLLNEYINEREQNI